MLLGSGAWSRRPPKLRPAAQPRSAATMPQGELGDRPASPLGSISRTTSIGVSEPYAADIRAGERVPHPRHWQTLAQLVGAAPKCAEQVNRNK